jgi:PAB-dependent poly(A)-specific ribonuclease subunit 3
LDMMMLLRSAATAPGLGIPETVNQYYNLMPLESAPSPVLPGAVSRCMAYKAVSAESGSGVVLRRILGPPPAHSVQIIRAAEIWKRLSHPGIVTLREVFTTRGFTSHASGGVPVVNELMVAYDLCPRAETLQNLFLGTGHQHHALSEATMWAITTQLLAATAAVHAVGLTLRAALTPTSILVTGRNRVRINRVGLSDMFDSEGLDHLPGPGVSAPLNPGGGSSASSGGTGLANGARVVALQKEDLANLGRILLVLATRSQAAQVRAGVLASGARAALESLQRSGVYTADLVQVVVVLLGACAPGSRTVVREVLSMIGPRLAVEMSNVWIHADAVHGQLVKECDASRLFRLATLLGFVNERCDAATGDAQWSETGDRYLLKLFRDYVFHQADESGRPVLDFAHVVECLNRLDVGSPEQILLSSRDGISLIAASFEDLRRCLMQAADELRQRAVAGPVAL